MCGVFEWLIWEAPEWLPEIAEACIRIGTFTGLLPGSSLWEQWYGIIDPEAWIYFWREPHGNPLRWRFFLDTYTYLQFGTDAFRLNDVKVPFHAAVNNPDFLICVEYYIATGHIGYDFKSSPLYNFASLRVVLEMLVSGMDEAALSARYSK